MALFARSQKGGVLGVDIGASSIKIVELVLEKGRPKLMTYGYAELPSRPTDGILLDQPKEAGALLADVWKQAGCLGTTAMAALPSSHVFSTILTLPKPKDAKQLKTMIDAEIEKLAPLPLSEMITYTTVIDGAEEKEQQNQIEGETQKKFVRVLVTGAARTLVQKYIEIFKIAKLQLQALDTEAFALVRSLIGKDRGAIMLIDIGAKRTNITVVEKGIPFVTRSINIGGDLVTQRISGMMNIEVEEAESMKRDFGTLGMNQTGAVPPLLEPLFQPLLNEARYAMELFASMELTQLKKIEKLILTGGSSHLPQLIDFLATSLNINVYRGNPWARMVYPQDLAVVLEEIGPRMSVAVGLAMREMES